MAPRSSIPNVKRVSKQTRKNMASPKTSGVQTRTRSQSNIQSQVLPAVQTQLLPQTTSSAPTRPQSNHSADTVDDALDECRSETSDAETEDNIDDTPLDDDEELEEMISTEESQAALIQQLRRQLKEAEKLQKGDKTQMVVPTRKRVYISPVSDVLEDHQAKKSKTSRRLPNPDDLREKIIRQHSVSKSVASASSPSSFFDSSYGTPEPDPADIIGSASTFQTPEPSKSGLVDTARPDQQNAYSPGHRDVISQAKRYINLYIATQNPFPTHSEKRQMNASALKAANNDCKHSAVLTSYISMILSKHMSKYRYRWKQAAEAFIVEKYGLVGTPEAIQERVKYLTTSSRYIYRQIFADADGQDRYIRPFAHDSIIQVIHEGMFKLRQGPARIQPNVLNPMPFETIAFAGVVILHCLEEYSTGKYKKGSLEGDRYEAEYKKHLVRLEKYETTKREHCHELQKNIYTTGMALLNVIVDVDDDFIIDSSDEMLPESQ